MRTRRLLFLSGRSGGERVRHRHLRTSADPIPSAHHPNQKPPPYHPHPSHACVRPVGAEQGAPSRVARSPSPDAAMPRHRGALVHSPHSPAPPHGPGVLVPAHRMSGSLHRKVLLLQSGIEYFKCVVVTITNETILSIHYFPEPCSRGGIASLIRVVCPREGPSSLFDLLIGGIAVKSQCGEIHFHLDA